MSEKLLDMVDEVEEELSPMEDSHDRAEGHKCTDKDWVYYILDQLADHELVDGNPTTDGLRRVCEEKFGLITVSDSQPISYHHELNEAVVRHYLEIIRYDIDRKISVSACVNVKSLPNPFSNHTEATACTRAEGKALRRAMKIRVHTAEELTNEDDDISLKEEISDQQKMGIRVLCKRLNVDLIKFVNTHTKDPKSFGEVKNLEGRLMLEELSKFQREAVPKDLVGYNDSWEESFGG